MVPLNKSKKLNTNYYYYYHYYYYYYYVFFTNPLPSKKNLKKEYLILAQEFG